MTRVIIVIIVSCRKPFILLSSSCSLDTWLRSLKPIILFSNPQIKVITSPFSPRFGCISFYMSHCLLSCKSIMLSSEPVLKHWLVLLTFVLSYIVFIYVSCVSPKFWEWHHPWAMCYTEKCSNMPCIYFKLYGIEQHLEPRSCIVLRFVCRSCIGLFFPFAIRIIWEEAEYQQTIP